MGPSGTYDEKIGQCDRGVHVEIKSCDQSTKSDVLNLNPYSMFCLVGKAISCRNQQ